MLLTRKAPERVCLQIQQGERVEDITAMPNSLRPPPRKATHHDLIKQYSRPTKH